MHLFSTQYQQNQSETTLILSHSQIVHESQKIHIETEYQKELYDRFFEYLSDEYPLLDTKIKKLIAFIEENKFCEL